MSNLRTSEAALLETWRIALENAVSQPGIVREMGELGYNAAKIEEGHNLLAWTRTVYDFNKLEDTESSEASRFLKVARQALHKHYMLHRKKAKIVFRDRPDALRRLQLDTPVQSSYIGWIEQVKAFYAALLSEPDLLKQLSNLKVDDVQVADARKQIGTVEHCRADYLREKGESEDATQQKDNALRDMERWMSDFYAVARIALEDSPQLLEALGKTVK
jgi:hypothetical protein